MAAFLDRVPLRGGCPLCKMRTLVNTLYAHRRNAPRAEDAQARRHTPPSAFCLRAKCPFARKSQTRISYIFRCVLIYYIYYTQRNI